MKYSLDLIDCKLMTCLQEDARLSFRALGRQVELSQPAVADRVRRLENAGVLAGYRGQIDRAAAGLPITAFLRVRCTTNKFKAVQRLACDLPAVLECHHVTGEDCFLVKVAAAAMSDLEATIERFREHGETVSSVVLSTVAENKPVALNTVDAS
ncbi:MAG: Lrp/AsnC family transcriptional regulator [Rhodospirillaceae bacterium]